MRAAPLFHLQEDRLAARELPLGSGQRDKPPCIRSLDECAASGVIYLGTSHCDIWEVADRRPVSVFALILLQVPPIRSFD